jgi:hypothetical protein
VERLLAALDGLPLDEKVRELEREIARLEAEEA